MGNSYEKREFLLFNLLFYLEAWFLYKSLLFKTIDGMTLFNSVILLVVILMASFIIGYGIERKDRRNTVSIFMNILSGYGIYTLISYNAAMKSIFCNVLLVMTTCVVMYAFHLILQKREKGASVYKTVCVRLSAFVRGSHVIFTLWMMALLLVARIHPPVSPDTANIKSATSDIRWKINIDDHTEMLEKLNYKTWNSLSNEDKLTVLQAVADIERIYLGIPHELNVQAEEPERLSIQGSYLEKTHTISVSTISLRQDAPIELVNTICHESYHAYQYCLVRMYEECPEDLQHLKVYSKVKQYRYEFDHYISGEEDYKAYYSQLCEEDARKYAQNTDDLYFWETDKLYARLTGGN